jgi:hypothetical protein
MLDHAMTGVLTHLGLWVLVVAGSRQDRARLAAAAFLVGLSTLILCLLWPWYGFVDALRTSLPQSLPAVGVLTRLPLPGLIFPHLALGVFIHQSGLLRPTTWLSRARTLFVGKPDETTRVASEILVAAMVIYFLVPQLAQAAKEPHLFRPYIAPLLGKKDKQLRITGVPTR